MCSVLVPHSASAILRSDRELCYMRSALFRLFKNKYNGKFSRQCQKHITKKKYYRIYSATLAHHWLSIVGGYFFL